MGQIVHPQQWQDVNYNNKNVVVIGSGATAVTLVPALVDDTAGQTARHVTMLQRSPTYVASVNGQDKVLEALNNRFDWLNKQPLYELLRWRNLLFQQGVYQFATHAPKTMKAILTHKVKQDLKGSDVSIKHFSPDYKPWDQRLCAVPDGDLFKALQQGRADIVTGDIERFSATGVVLTSGQTLPADIIVTATGLKVQMLGGATISVDGNPIEVGNCLTYKAVMLEGVPNMAVLFGYTNASWTLKIELACQYLLRLFEYMQKHHLNVVVAKTGNKKAGSAKTSNKSSNEKMGKKTKAHKNSVNTLPDTIMGSLNAGYIQRAQDELPKQGDRYPWRVENHYLKDRRMLLKEGIKDKWLILQK